MKWFFEVAAELAVVGSNPELADSENPQGLIFGDRFFVTATDEQGNVFAHRKVTLDHEQAKHWLHVIETKMDQATFNPAGSEHWDRYRSVYGSDAYLNHEAEIVEQEKREAMDC